MTGKRSRTGSGTKVIATIALLGGCAAAGAGAGAADAHGCSIVEVSRDSLWLEDGRLLYVQASAFVADERGHVLLAGVPNFSTTISPGDVVTNVETDAVFGAVIEPDGSARAVPIPLERGRLGGIRAAPAEGGGWHVVFGEVPDFTGDSYPRQTDRVWYGRFDGERWGRIERLPSPEPGSLAMRLSSSLVVGGDTLAWATRRTAPDEAQRLALYRRTGGRWTYEALPIFHAYVEPAFLPERGLSLLVVGGAPDPGESDANSLLLWTRSPEWRFERKLVHSPAEGMVEFPGIAVAPDAVSISWHSPTEFPDFGSPTRARALVGVGVDREMASVVLDARSSWTQYPFAPLLLGTGTRVWVSQSHADGDRKELSFLTDSGTSSVLLGRWASPYLLPEFTRAISLGTHDVMITGIHLAPGDRVTSLLIRARLRCAAP